MNPRPAATVSKERGTLNLIRRQYYIAPRHDMIFQNRKTPWRSYHGTTPWRSYHIIMPGKFAQTRMQNSFLYKQGCTSTHLNLSPSLDECKYFSRCCRGGTAASSGTTRRIIDAASSSFATRKVVRSDGARHCPGTLALQSQHVGSHPHAEVSHLAPELCKFHFGKAAEIWQQVQFGKLSVGRIYYSYGENY